MTAQQRTNSSGAVVVVDTKVLASVCDATRLSADRADAILLHEESPIFYGRDVVIHES
jgi:hypothetical protein